MPLPEHKGAQQPLNPQLPSPNLKVLGTLEFAGFGEGLTVEPLEAWTTASIRWALREHRNPNAVYGGALATTAQHGDREGKTTGHAIGAGGDPPASSEER